MDWGKNLGRGRVANLWVSEGTVRELLVIMRTMIMLVFWSLKEKTESRGVRMVSPIKCRRKVEESGDWIKGLRFGSLVTFFFFKKQFQLSVKSRYQIAMTYWGSKSRKYMLYHTSSVIGSIVERKKKCENCFKFMDLIVTVHKCFIR